MSTLLAVATVYPTPPPTTYGCEFGPCGNQISDIMTNPVIIVPIVIVALGVFIGSLIFKKRTLALISGIVFAVSAAVAFYFNPHLISTILNW